MISVKRFLRWVGLVTCLAAFLFGQTSTRTYSISGVTGSVSTYAISLLQQTTNTRRVKIHSITISLPGAGTVTVERGGTVATSTSTTPAPTRDNAPAAAFSAYLTSNAGSGTEIGRMRLEAAGVVPLAGLHMTMDSHSQTQYTVRVSLGSAGAIHYAIVVEEVQP